MGARRLDRQSFPLSDRCLVDLLPLAKSTDVDVFPVRVCPDLANNLVSGIAPAFSALNQARANYKRVVVF
jgi:hypothetical protein